MTQFALSVMADRILAPPGVFFSTLKADHAACLRAPSTPKTLEIDQRASWLLQGSAGLEGVGK